MKEPIYWIIGLANVGCVGYNLWVLLTRNLAFWMNALTILAMALNIFAVILLAMVILSIHQTNKSQKVAK